MCNVFCSSVCTVPPKQNLVPVCDVWGFPMPNNLFNILQDGIEMGKNKSSKTKKIHFLQLITVYAYGR